MKINYIITLLSLMRLKASCFYENQLGSISGGLILSFIIINLYVLTFINGIFWDDWIIHNRTKDFYNSFFRSAGAFTLVGHIHYFFQSMGVWFYKALIFAISFTSVILFWLILNEIRLSESLKKILVLCFIIFPLFESRYLSINIFYVVSIAFFLFAFLLILRGKIFIAQLFFWISYINNSYILVGPISIIFYIFIFKDKRKINGLALTAFTAVLFVLIKYSFYVPYGDYKGYNHISLSLIGAAIFNFIAQFGSLIKWIFEQISGEILRALFFLFVGCSLSYFLLFRNLNIVIDKLSSIDRKFFLFIALISLVGLLPYFLVGKSPLFYYDYGSRHFSGSFIGFVGLVGYFAYFVMRFQSNVGMILITFLFGFMITVNFLIMDNYRIDSLKSRSIIHALQKIDNLPNKLIIVHDATNISWANRRIGLSYYEWGGIFRSHFGDGISDWNYFVYDAIFWSGEGCYKSSGLYRQDFSADIRDRHNNLATYIYLKLDSPIFYNPFELDLIVDVKKNVDVCSRVCDKCGF